jgi:GNAT superfamily N-acetyltransferase
MSTPTRGHADVTIRSAQSSDAKAIAEVTKQLGYSTEPTAVAGRLSRLLTRGDQQLLVADHRGRAVGWIHMVITEYIEADAFVVIGGLVVDREYRRQGIGHRLLTRAEEWAAERGCALVRVSSNVKRVEAHGLYERAGYTNLKTQYAFAKRVGSVGPEALRALVPDVT